MSHYDHKKINYDDALLVQARKDRDEASQRAFERAGDDGSMLFGPGSEEESRCPHVRFHQRRIYAIHDWMASR